MEASKSVWCVPPTVRSIAGLVMCAGIFLVTGVATASGPTLSGRGGGSSDRPRCDRPLPIAGRPAGFRHFRNRLTARPAAAQHRGIDLFVRQGAPQVVTAKFAYDFTDRDLTDEDVDIYLLRDCRRWEYLGAARTSRDGDAVVLSDGSITRDGGQVSVRIPWARALLTGLHRVRFVVRGDRTAADALVNVLAPGARVVVTDVDGTLTHAEAANFRHRVGLSRRSPAANPGAATMLSALARGGYQIFYLTGRPDWDTAGTRAWLTSNGFPPGVLRTRPHAGLGLGGGATTRFKIAELRAVTHLVGQAPAWGFGNTAIDVAAYREAGIAPERRWFYRYGGETAGGRRHDDYRVLALTVAAGRERFARLDSSVHPN